MPLTAKQISSMTLADLEAVAVRFGNAVATIRDAQALMSGGTAAPAPRIVMARDAVGVLEPRPIQVMSIKEAEAAVSDDETWRQGLSAEQQAFLERKRANGERAKLVEGMRGGA